MLIKLTSFGRGQLQGGQIVSPQYSEGPSYQLLDNERDPSAKMPNDVEFVTRVKAGRERRPGCEIQMPTRQSGQLVKVVELIANGTARAVTKRCRWGLGAGGPAKASLSANVTTRCKLVIYYR